MPYIRYQAGARGRELPGGGTQGEQEHRVHRCQVHHDRSADMRDSMRHKAYHTILKYVHTIDTSHPFPHSLFTD